MKKYALGFMRYESKIANIQTMIDYSLNNQITCFETCSFYLNHQCEKLVNNALKKYNRDSYQIIGKMPLIGSNSIRIIDFELFFNSQIKNVNGNYFDIYLLQAVDLRSILDLQTTNIINFLHQEKEKGHIKRLGISIQTTDDIFKKCLKLYDWDIIQMPLNIIDYYCNYYEDNYNLAVEKNIPIIAQAPLKGGCLKKDLDEALNFINNLSQVEIILFGNTQIDTLSNNLSILNNIYPVDKDKIKSIINQYYKNAYIECLYCGYCNNICHLDLPIHSLFYLHNQALKNKESFKSYDILYKNLESNIQNCNNCNKCSSACPVNLKIPEIIKGKLNTFIT